MNLRARPAWYARWTGREWLTAVVATVLIVTGGVLVGRATWEAVRWSRDALATHDAPSDMAGAAPAVVGPLPRPRPDIERDAPAASEEEARAPEHPAGPAGDPDVAPRREDVPLDAPARRVPPAAPSLAAAPERLSMPVEGVSRDDLFPSFDEPRGTRRHEAIDIMAARGTPVRAAADGTVAKLFTSDAGGLTVYQFDRDERRAFYYAHLDRYREGLEEGDVLARGEVIGYVGSTGNAAEDAPHLHFAIFVLGPDKRWWEGTPIDPYPLLRGEGS